jgi:N utilization substance protein A
MATQAGVDPVGACVGIKGVRIQAIVKELHDEKIDIIQWDADPIVYISKAISPARVSGVYLNDVDGNRTATVVVMEDQLSLAIGRDGQNARLAAKLTGWRIDIKSVVEAASDALSKLQKDDQLAASVPAAAELMPQVEEILAKKAENRPVTPEEYTTLGQFVDRVERRTIPVKEVTVHVPDEQVAAARAGVPSAAFEMPLDQLNLKEHVFNILTEANFETVGDLILAMKLDANKVLGLPGVGPKAIQNIEEQLATVNFPEPAPEPVVEVSPIPVAEAAPLEAQPVESVPAEAGEETKALSPQGKAVLEEPENENAKDGVSLDELFKMKPEIFQATDAVEEEDDDKKKGKKKKKKGVELVLDEDLGEVVGRKIHKRGDGEVEE